MAEATSVTEAAPPQQTQRRSKGLSERRLAFLMVSPSMVLIALVAAYPIGYGIWLSLHEYSVRVAGLSRWAGLRNYTTALGDSEWWAAFTHTMIFASRRRR
jgi:multiple sugar transport system permease protein